MSLCSISNYPTSLNYIKKLTHSLPSKSGSLSAPFLPMNGNDVKENAQSYFQCLSLLHCPVLQNTFGHHSSPINHPLSVLTVAQPDYPVHLTSWVTLHQITEQTTRLMLEHVILWVGSLPSFNFVYRMELKLFSLKAKILSPTFSPSSPSTYIYSLSSFIFLMLPE